MSVWAFSTEAALQNGDALLTTDQLRLTVSFCWRKVTAICVVNVNARLKPLFDLSQHIINPCPWDRDTAVARRHSDSIAEGNM